MVPTQKSVTARLRYRSLDGGWSEVSLCKATRIRVFPRTAVIDRKILTIERKISSPCTSAVNSAEQDSTTIVFWFSPSVKLFSVILCALQLRARYILRANVCNFRESVDSREFLNFFIFCPHNLYSTLISKITLKLVTAFYFFLNRAKFEKR